jgi:hypothetical protein
MINDRIGTERLTPSPVVNYMSGRHTSHSLGVNHLLRQTIHVLNYPLAKEEDKKRRGGDRRGGEGKGGEGKGGEGKRGEGRGQREGERWREGGTDPQMCTPQLSNSSCAPVWKATIG